MTIKNLEEIASKYKNVFNSFFNDEEVKKTIIQSHMGEKEYEEKSKKYDDIMKKIVFVPYVQLKDLQKFIKEKRKEFVNDQKEFYEKYKDEINLTHKLTLKYNEIYEKNFKELYNCISQKNQKALVDITIDKNGVCNYKNANTGNIEENFKILKEAINVNLQDMRPNFINKRKIKKINKQIEEYEKITSQKAFMETSTFYENKRDLKDQVLDTDIIDNPATYIKNEISKTKNGIKRSHYVYVPVMRMENREDLMVAVAHEVSHAIKGNVKNNKYSSGFARYKIGNSRAQKIAIDGVIDDSNIYNQFEEFSHHYMTRESMGMNDKNKNKGLAKKWNELCEKNLIPNNLFLTKKFPADYEFNDNISGNFVKKLRTLIQDLNSGKITREQFSKYIGGNNKTKKLAELSIERMQNQSNGIQNLIKTMNDNKISLQGLIKTTEVQEKINQTNQKSLQLENDAIKDIDEMSQSFEKNKFKYLKDITKKTKASKIVEMSKVVSKLLDKTKSKNDKSIKIDEKTL